MEKQKYTQPSQEPQGMIPVQTLIDDDSHRSVLLTLLNGYERTRFNPAQIEKDKYTNPDEYALFEDHLADLLDDTRNKHVAIDSYISGVTKPRDNRHSLYEDKDSLHATYGGRNVISNTVGAFTIPQATPISEIYQNVSRTTTEVVLFDMAAGGED